MPPAEHQGSPHRSVARRPKGPDPSALGRFHNPVYTSHQAPGSTIRESRAMHTPIKGLRMYTKRAAEKRG